MSNNAVLNKHNQLIILMKLKAGCSQIAKLIFPLPRIYSVVCKVKNSNYLLLK